MPAGARCHVGQNAHLQVETFKALVQVTGLVVTKLDGTARGGVLVALAERFGLPVRAIGVGEGADDLRPFAAASYARSPPCLPTEGITAAPAAPAVMLWSSGGTHLAESVGA